MKKGSQDRLKWNTSEMTIRVYDLMGFSHAYSKYFIFDATDNNTVKIGKNILLYILCIGRNGVLL